MVRTWREPAFGTARHYFKINGIKIHWYLVWRSREGKEHRVIIERAWNNRSPLNLTHSLISYKEFLSYLPRACLLTIPGSHIALSYIPFGSFPIVFKVHIARWLRINLNILQKNLNKSNCFIVTKLFHKTCHPESIEWILEDQVSSRRMIWLLPNPPTPSVSSAGDTQEELRNRDNLLTREGGEGGGGGAKSYDSEKAWSSKYYSIISYAIPVIGT